MGVLASGGYSFGTVFCPAQRWATLRRPAMNSHPVPPGRYDSLAIALHWALALALLAQIGLGWYVHEIPRGTLDRGLFINLHKSIGLTLGLLVLLRLWWRLRRGVPAWPAALSRRQVLAARLAHGALYACMLLLPLTGYLASNFSRHGIKYFNTLVLPPWGPDHAAVYGALNATHAAVSYLLVALIAVHVLAAGRHLLRGDGVFQRMLPRAGGRATPAAPALAGGLE
jgi:cytochrome b561